MKTKKDPLILLDSHAIIHRAYHALPDFTSPTGEPTGALYGLCTMLMRIIDDFSPSMIIACFDRPETTYRHEVLPSYKGTRAKTDDALITQLERARDVIRAFGIPIVELAGFEADDLIATLSVSMRDHTPIIIASGDMDALQLVEDREVMVYTLKRGLSDTILFDQEGVTAKYGFPPLRVPDYKGLAGDPSDNIKGVPGIGEKTAKELLRHFDSIDGIYSALDTDENLLLEKGIKPRIVNLLKEHREDAELSRMLATSKRDVPIGIPPHEIWRDKLDVDKVLELFDELNFRSLRGRFLSLVGDKRVEEQEELLPQEKVEEKPFREAQCMLWLIDAERTNPTYEDILSYANKKTFSEAYDALYEDLKKEPKLLNVYETIEAPLVPVLMKMESRGIKVDTKCLKKLKDAYTKELDILVKEIHTYAGHEFNTNSPRQLGAVLFDELQLTAKNQKKTSTGQRSTRESELEKIRDLHPIVNAVLEYRELQKLLSTYIDAIPSSIAKDGKLHTTFLQTGSSTGRMASVDPNLQNIPTKTPRGAAIRNAFIASDDMKLVSIDYSQIELRIAAFLSGDKKLIEVFMSGGDIHTAVASEVFKVPKEAVDKEMRRRAKVINFGILYGMGVNALKVELGTTQGDAQKYLHDYFETYTGLKEYIEKVKGDARKNGYTETFFGRRRPLPGIQSDFPQVLSQAERIAVNAPIQGTQADIIKIAMTRIDTLLREKNMQEKVHMLLQVHDELIFEMDTSVISEIVPHIRACMESVLSLEESKGIPIPAEAKVGDNWGEMEKI